MTTRLILDLNATAGVSGNVKVYGSTTGAETVQIFGGNVELDASFNRGGDTVQLMGNAADYTARMSGSTLILSNGTTTVSIPVGTVGATVAFADASRVLRFDESIRAVTLGDQQISSTTAPLAAGPGSLYSVTAAEASVTEGDVGTKSLSFMITLDRAPSSPVTLNYETLIGAANGSTADANDDFIPVSGSVTFAAGQRSAVVSVQVVGDLEVETGETVAVKLSGAALATERVITGTIRDNDVALDTAPVFTTPSRELQAAENQLQAGTVLASDAQGDPIVYAIVGGADAALFTIDPATGVLRFIEAPNFEEPGSAAGTNRYEVTVRAAAGGKATFQDLSVVVTNANDAPTSTNLSIVTLEDQAASGQLPAVVDQDGATGLRYELATPAAHGTATVAANGAYTYTPNADYNGPDAFSFTVSDGAGGRNTYTVQVGVTPQDDAAVVRVEFTGPVREGATVTAVVAASDIDAAVTGTTYQWQISADGQGGWANLPGATAASYTVASDQSQVGQYLRVVVTTTDALGGTTTHTSAATTVIENTDDPATGVPAIVGTPAEGGQLGVDLGSLADVDGGLAAGGYSYQWQRLDGTTWIDLDGETGATLAIPDDQSLAEQQVRVQVTTTDNLGGSSTLTSEPVLVRNVDDAAQGMLSITGMPAQEGGRLTVALVDASDADGAITIAYAWQVHDGGAWRTVATGDTVDIPATQAWVGLEGRVVVTTTDALGGTTEFIGDAVTIGNTDDAATGTLAVVGAPVEGGTLSASIPDLADEDGSASLAFQWQEDIDGTWTDIAGATSADLIIPADQSYVGKSVRVVATSSDAFGGTTVFEGEAQTIRNVDDAASGSLSVTGDPSQGGSLTASLTNVEDADGATTVTYQWQEYVNDTWTDIAAATGATLEIPADQQELVGLKVRVVATSTDALGGQTRFEGEEQTILNVDDPATGELVVTGSAAEGGTLTARIADLADVDGSPEVAFQWEEEIDGTWTAIEGADTAELSIPGDQSWVGKSVRVVATTTDAFGGETTFQGSAQTIRNVNDLPELVSTYRLPAGFTSIVNIGDLATDADGDALRFVSFTNPAHGTLTLLSAGTQLRYQPDPGYSGPERIFITVSDGTGFSTREVTFNVNFLPQWTLAIEGEATQGQTLRAVVDVTDGDGVGTLAYQWLRDGVAIEGATQDRYVLTNDDVGSAISYTVTYTDGIGNVEDHPSGTISPVANVNDHPTVQDLELSGAEDSVLQGSVAGLGSDIDAGTVLRYEEEDAPIDGLVFNADGTFSFDPSGLAPLAPGQTHVVSFRYVADDGELHSDPRTVTLIITNANDAPQAQADVAVSGSEDDAAITGQVAGTDIDGDSLSYAVSGATPEGLVFNADGSFSFDPSALTAYQSAKSGGSTTVSFNYVANDGRLDSAPQTVTITLAGANDAPTIVDRVYVHRGDLQASTTFTVPELAGDVDGDALFGRVSPAQHGSVTMSPDGQTLVYTPNDPAYVGLDSFELTITDNGNPPLSTTRTVTVVVGDDVLNSTGRPAIVGEARQGETLSVDLSAIRDADGLGSFSYQWYRDSQPIDGATGPTLLLDNDDVGHVFTVEVGYTDGNPLGGNDGTPAAGTTYRLFSLATGPVANVNDAPQGAPSATLADTSEDVGILLLEADLLAGFSDIDVGDTLSVANISATNGTLSAFVGGWVFTPDADYNGPVTVTYDVVDDGSPALSVTGVTRSFNVGAVNDAPTITSQAADAAGEVTEVIDDLVSTTFTATGTLRADDVDLEANAGPGDTLAWSLDGADEDGVVEGTYGRIRIDAQTGQWTYELDDTRPATQELNVGDQPVETFTARVRDAEGLSATQTVTVTVKGRDDAPEIVDSLRVDEDSVGNLFRISDYASDVDNSPSGIARQLVSQARHGTVISNSDGSFIYTPNADFTGEDQVFIRVISNGRVVEKWVTIQVDNTPDDASIAGDADGEVVEDATLTASGTLTVSDVDPGEARPEAGTAQGSYGAFTVAADGTWTYQLDNDAAAVQALADGQAQVEQFTVRSVDGTASQIVSITVAGANDAPTIQSTIADASLVLRQVQPGSRTEAGGNALQASIETAAAFADVDQGDLLSFGVTLEGFDQVPEWLQLDPATGTLTVDLTLAQLESFSPSDRFTATVTATDLHGASVSDTFEFSLELAPVVLSVADAAAHLYTIVTQFRSSFSLVDTTSNVLDPLYAAIVVPLAERVDAAGRVRLDTALAMQATNPNTWGYTLEDTATVLASLDGSDSMAQQRVVAQANAFVASTPATLEEALHIEALDGFPNWGPTEDLAVMPISYDVEDLSANITAFDLTQLSREHVGEISATDLGQIRIDLAEANELGDRFNPTNEVVLVLDGDSLLDIDDVDSVATTIGVEGAASRFVNADGERTIDYVLWNGADQPLLNVALVNALAAAGVQLVSDATFSVPPQPYPLQRYDVIDTVANLTVPQGEASVFGAGADGFLNQADRVVVRLAADGSNNDLSGLTLDSRVSTINLNSDASADSLDPTGDDRVNEAVTLTQAQYAQLDETDRFDEADGGNDHVIIASGDHEGGLALDFDIERLTLKNDTDDTTSLDVVLANASAKIVVEDASDAVTVDAVFLGDNRTLALDGAGDVTVNNVQATVTIDAHDPLTGTLTVNTLDEGYDEADAITVITYTNDTTINAADELDSITVEADFLADGKTLTLSGESDVVVNDVQNDVTVDASDALNGELVVNLKSEETLDYLGSWRVMDGPHYGTNPPTYSGLTAAALLFGDEAGTSNPSAFATSTIGPDVVDRQAWYSIYGGGMAVYPEDYLPFPEYSDQGASAYIGDWDYPGAINYAFLVGAEPYEAAVNVLTGTNNTTVNAPSSLAFVTVDAAQMLGAKTLTLTGTATFDVQNVAAAITVDAANGEQGLLSGELTVEVSNANGADTVTVLTGSNDTSISGAGAALAVDAAEMLDATTLTLSGSSNAAVDNANESLTIAATGLGGTLAVTADDDGVLDSGDTLTVNTGSADTTISAADADDQVNVDAAQMTDNTTLTLSGGASATVANANATMTVDAGDLLGGTLSVTVAAQPWVGLADGGDDILGRNYISDGGDDIYDGGNNLSTEFESDIAYGSGAIVAGSETSGFGAGSSYVSGLSQSVFVTLVSGNASDTFAVTGETGADGRGTEDAGLLGVTHRGFSAVYYRTYEGRGADPAIGRLVIFSSAVAADLTLEALDGDTNSEDLLISAGLSNSSTLAYVSLYGASDAAIPLDDLEAVFRNVVDQVFFLGQADATEVADLASQIAAFNAVGGPALAGDIALYQGEEAGDTLTVITGTDDTTVNNPNDQDSVVVDAAALLNDNTLTLTGQADVRVNTLTGDVDAAGLTGGTLVVNAADNIEDNGIRVTTGARDTSILGTATGDTLTVEADALASGSTLKLDGGADVVVNDVQASVTVDASDPLTGPLVVNIVENRGAADTVTVITYTNDTTVNAADANDAVVVEADFLADGKTLTLTGASQVTVNDVQENVTVAATALSGELAVNGRDDGEADSFTVETGSNDTTIVDPDGLDDITVDASALLDDNVLTLGGNADVVVTDLVADVDASTLLGGTLDVTTAVQTVRTDLGGVDPDLSTGKRYIYAVTVTAAVGGGGVWGDTEGYTSDSDLARIALRDGQLAEGQTGVIWVEWMAGQDSYADGEEINGVDPSGFGGWDNTIRLLTPEDVTALADDPMVVIEGLAGPLAVNIATGAAATDLHTSNTGDQVAVDATVLAQNVALTIDGLGDVTVTHLVGDIDAAGLEGTLDVTTADAEDDGISIVTGSNDTTIDATGADDVVTVDAGVMADQTTLALSGASAVVVEGVDQSITVDADDLLEGELTVNVVSTDVDERITVLTGSADTAVNGAGAELFVDATQMLATTTLTLSGDSAAEVDNANATMTVDASGLDGVLQVVSDDDGADTGDTLTVITGSNSSFVTASDADDTLNVQAGVMADGSTLTLYGAATTSVTQANASIQIDASALTGTLSVTADDDGADTADTLTVLTGSNDTSVTAADADDTVDVDATALADDNTLTLSGEATVNVTNLLGDVDAAGLTGGVLDITTRAVDPGDETAVPATIAITTGAKDTTITGTDADDTVTVAAGAMLETSVLALDGESAFTVTGLVADLTASALNGSLQVTVGDASDDDDAITITTGTGDTTILGTAAGDTVTVEAAALADGSELKLDGAADVVVNAVQASVTIDASDPLTGTLEVNAVDDDDADSITVITYTGDTTVNAADELDTVDIDADWMPDDGTLTTTGAADFTITNLTADLVNTSSGTVVVTLAGSDAELSTEEVGSATTSITIDSTNDITVNNGTLDDNDEIVLVNPTAIAAFTVNGVLADVDATATDDDVTINLADAGDDAIAITTGSGTTRVLQSAAGDVITIDAENLPDNGDLEVQGAAEVRISNLLADLTGGTVTGAITVDLDQDDAGFDEEIDIDTGAGDDRVNVGTRKLTDNLDNRSSTLDLGAGSNLVTTLDGANVSGAVLGVADGGTIDLWIAANATVTVDASQLVSIVGSTIFNDILIGDPDGVSLLEEFEGPPATNETVVVVTRFDALTGYTLDADVNNWDIGFTLGDAGNSVTVNGANQAVNIVFGQGPDALALGGATAVHTGTVDFGDEVGSDVDTLELQGGRAAGQYAGLEYVDASAGGDISTGQFNGSTVGGPVTGLTVDFGSATADLVMTVDQNNSLDAFVASGTGTQTVTLSDGGVVEQRVGIDVYDFSDAGNTLVQTLSSPLVVNGGAGIDVVISSASDAERGQLTIDLGEKDAGGSDIVGLRNTNISGLGGAVMGWDAEGDSELLAGGSENWVFGRVWDGVDEWVGSPVVGYSNATQLNDTIALWDDTAGTSAAVIEGFTTAGGAGYDKIAFFDGDDEVTIGGYASDVELFTNTLGGLSTNSVIEIKSEFQLSDPLNLGAVATMLTGLNNVQDGRYYVVMYDGNGPNANAYVFAATATEGDGFDFADVNGAVDGFDTDTVELIGVITDVVADSLTSLNFVSSNGLVPPAP